MRPIVQLSLAAVALLAVQPALAQTPPPADVTFVSAAEIAAMMAKDKAQVKPDVPTIYQPLLRLAPYSATLEYRTGKGLPAVHETEAELFYVIDGSGVIVLGGHLTGLKRYDEHTLSGDGIEGGESRKIGKGDVFIVPQGAPHQVVSADGSVTLMTMHVPRP
jgi:mannose-6-phosphate isomerase-like protein (cupin superfamily)